MASTKGDSQSEKKVRFNYVKSNLFRVIHTDGAMAAWNPNGNVTINLYSQRFSIPEEVIFDLDDDDEIVGEGIVVEREKENIDTTIIREIDVLAVMDLETAVELVRQLQNIIAEYTDEDE
jgi:hypothetical protein